MSKMKLAPGERLDGAVEFDRPGFKYKKERLLLQIAMPARWIRFDGAGSLRARRALNRREENHYVADRVTRRNEIGREAKPDVSGAYGNRQRHGYPHPGEPGPEQGDMHTIKRSFLSSTRRPTSRSSSLWSHWPYRYLFDVLSPSGDQTATGRQSVFTADSRRPARRATRAACLPTNRRRQMR